MTTEAVTWLDYLTAFGAVATPIMVLILTAIGWGLRSKIERQHELEDKLREDRINTYNTILEPFVIMLTSDAAWESDPKNKKRDKNSVGSQKMLSLEYRRAAFKMTLVAPDPVVQAHNRMMQFFYEMGHQKIEPDLSGVKGMLEHLGEFLLEIRKSMGNEATTLHGWNMIEWMMSEAEKIRKSDGSI